MCAEPCDGCQNIYADQFGDMSRRVSDGNSTARMSSIERDSLSATPKDTTWRASECSSAVRVGSIERDSLSAEPKDTPCGGLETARAPVVAAQRMGRIMAAKSLAAVWSVRRAREHAHQPALCDGEVFTKSGEGHSRCEHAESATSCACRATLRVRSGEHGSRRPPCVNAAARILRDGSHFGVQNTSRI